MKHFAFAIETHILDKSIDFNNLNISIKFVERIRDNKKFNDFIELLIFLFFNLYIPEDKKTNTLKKALT